jgi:hypothetical protein
MCQLNEKIKKNVLEGKFVMDVVEKSTGNVIDHYEDDNVIVIDAKEAIIYSISGSSVGHVSILKIGDDIGPAVTISGTPNITFSDTNPDTIVRDTGSWITDGYIDQMTLDITGSASNNGTGIYTVDSVTATTITLIAGNTVVAEGPSAGISITGNPSNNNPASPTENYNTSSMSIVHTATDYGSLSIGYASLTSTSFSMTISGTDVLSNYPTETSKIFTSAALHSTNGKVFAYKRFPQKSVSDLVDINISWTISY